MNYSNNIEIEHELIKQQELKKEQERKKLRKLKKTLEEEKKRQIWEGFVSSKNGKISWKNPDNVGFLFEGYFKDSLIFEIRKGISTYSLKRKDPRIIKKFSIHSSIYLEKLITKAEKILSENLTSNK